MVCIDDQGYPTDEFLDYIKTCEPENLEELQEVISLIEESWEHRDMAFIRKRPCNGTQSIEMHTVGWSGNESIIDAIISNFWLTHFRIRYVQWNVGGHYYFKLNLK